MTPPSQPLPQPWLRALGWVRDGWLIFGLALGLFLAIEGLYRAQRAARAALRGGRSYMRVAAGHHPYAGQEWWLQWIRQDVSRRQFRFDPYRTWSKKAVVTPYLHVDSAAHRLTIQHALGTAPARRVFMIGGSVLWGTTVRDSFTIASLVSLRLRERGFTDVEVVSLAEIAYNSTQEVISLLLELQKGPPPVLVVALDGHNDVAAAYQEGRAGTVLNQTLSEQKFEVSRAGVGSALADLGARAGLVQWLIGVTRRRSTWPGRANPVSTCRDVARTYRANALATQALGETFGFATVYFWQPVMDLSGKHLTPWERSLGRSGYYDWMVSCAAQTDSAMADRLGTAYVPMRDVFDADTSSIFIDNAGHVTEYGDGLIATRIADVIEPLLRAHPARAVVARPAGSRR